MRRRRTGAGVLSVAALAVSVFATVAVAQPFIGTTGDDVITGTDGRDSITGGLGNDTLNGLGRRDFIFGGRGKDTIDAGDGNDLVFAGNNDDTVNGGLGNDRIFAQRGVDNVNGGPGNDDLWALARADVTRQPGEPADTLNGGPGNDVFHVRDGEADHVNCGEDYDVVRADYKDVVANDCELVKRRGGRAKSHTENDDQNR
jgi:Ca2+-binding RTX toxin-like protein